MGDNSKYEGKQLLPIQFVWTKDLVNEGMAKVKEDVTCELRDFVKELILSMGLQPTKAIDEMDLEALRQELKLLVASGQNCELTGNQTESMNLVILQEGYTQQQEIIEQQQETISNLINQMNTLRDQFAKVEVESLPETIKRKLKQLEKQVKLLRAEGYSGPRHVKGLPTVPGSEKTSVELSGKSYEDPTGEIADIRGAIMSELKNALVKKGLADPPPPPKKTEFGDFDPSKCAEPLIAKDGSISQCPQSRFGKSRYCKDHQKPYEEKERKPTAHKKEKEKKKKKKSSD